MQWKKLGCLFCPEKLHPKLESHGANPLPIRLNGDVFRILYSGRDCQNRSSVGFVDADIVKQKIVYVHNEPLFGYGKADSFYSHGVSIGNCYEADGNYYVLFMGWQSPPDAHWRGDIGRLVLGPDWSLRIEEDRPFLSTNTVDPLSLSYPWVIQEGNNAYSMWYGSTVTWNAGNDEMLHVINYATSNDGHHWRRLGLALPFKIGEFQAFSRPSVVGNKNDGYHMWFSYRGGCDTKYRIGYAYSENGAVWENRLDAVGIDVSSSGWDSEMIEYPFVFDHNNERYMMYNGNGYGKTGFGLAVLDQD